MQETNDSFAHFDLEQLRTEHGNLEARLQRLDRHRSLSPEEQYEIQIIKKRKLAIKDQMNQMK
jgi:hypothetical protein